MRELWPPLELVFACSASLSCAVPCKPDTTPHLQPCTSPRTKLRVGRTHSLAASIKLACGVALVRGFSAASKGLQGAVAGGSTGPAWPRTCHRADPALKNSEGQPHRRHPQEAVRGSLAPPPRRREDGLGLVGGGHRARGLGREPRVPPVAVAVAVTAPRRVVAGRAVAKGEAAAFARAAALADTGGASTTINTT